ncbi:MAG: Hint domain-containing protein [Polyangiales bacterium]
MSYHYSCLFLVCSTLCALGGGACSEESCFAAGTLIDTPLGATPIEALREGDLVWGYDLRAGERVAATISRTFVHRNALVRDLRLAGGVTLRVTDEHPFYVPGEGRYVPASELSAGVELASLEAASLSETPLVSSSEARRRTTVYNIEVAGVHNYFAAGVLVHNKSIWQPLPELEIGMACEPETEGCFDAAVNAVRANASCILEAAPSLVDACTGTETVLNPVSCSTTELESTHGVLFLSVAGTEYFPGLDPNRTDCNAGFDLDGCLGTSCVNGGFAAGEGIDGVDNGLGGAGDLVANVAGNLVGINQAFYDGLCSGSVDIALELAPNFEEGCVNVRPIFGGTPAVSVIPMNLSDQGCISGTLGTVPLQVIEPPVVLANAVLRGTIDFASGFALELGGTVDWQTVSTVADVLIEGGSAVVPFILDINEDLSGDNNAECNALSVAFDMRGAL